MSKWKITDYRIVDKGAVAGRFTLQINDLQIRGWSHFRSDNGAEWVNGPQREYEKDGERKYFSFCYIEDKDRWRQFQVWALAEIERQKPQQEPQQTDALEQMPF
jgi:hypothetical protein